MFTLKVDQEIRLQLFQVQDSVRLFQLIEENREHLCRWLPWMVQITSPYQLVNIIPVWLKQFAENNGFHAAILYYEELVGAIGLHQVDWANRQTSIGYYLAKKAEGRGIMIRTVRALLNYIFFELELNRVEIRCGERNLKSRAIPEKLGFVMEGKIREGERLTTGYHDLILYSKLSREWQQNPVYNLF